MNRASFLKLGVLPLVVAGADAVKRFDPDGEPMREVDGQLVVNGDNVIVQNVSFRTGPARAAVQVNDAASHVTIRDNLVQRG